MELQQQQLPGQGSGTGTTSNTGISAGSARESPECKGPPSDDTSTSKVTLREQLL